MNKIKLMYDVAKTMKGKDLIKGTLRVECLKDDTPALRMDNEFSQNMMTGLTKVKNKTEINGEGKYFKNESSTEFIHPADAGPHGHGFPGKLRHFHHFAHHCGHGRGGLKTIFSGLALALDILSKTEVEEQADQTVLTLKMNELPEEFRDILAGRFRDGYGEDRFPEAPYHKRHRLMKELQTLENPELTLISRINKNNEIVSLEVSLSGKQTDDQGEARRLSFKAAAAFLYHEE